VTLIQKIELPTPGLEELRAEARAEGYNFIDTLVKEWSTGKNHFDQPGEILLGVIERDLLIAVGGLNRDPFLADPTTGRIRRIYVRAAWRNHGIGRLLITTLLQQPKPIFTACASAPKTQLPPTSTNVSASFPSTILTRPTCCPSNCELPAPCWSAICAKPAQ